MKAEYRKLLEILPTANSEEIKMLAKVLYNIIDCSEEIIKSKDRTIALLKQRITELESDEKPLLKIKDERIDFLADWLKDKDKEIERLRLQVRTNGFDQLFVFGTGKA
jgi:hypothetical protein